MSILNWHIIADRNLDIKSSIGAYSLNLSSGLSRTGARVHVWHTQEEGSRIQKSDVPKEVLSHIVPKLWNEDSFQYLQQSFEKISGKNRILIQYGPNSFGSVWNRRFAQWIFSRTKHGDEIWIMVHKAQRTPIGFQYSPMNILQRWLQTQKLKDLLRRCQFVFVSTPNWLGELGKKLTCCNSAYLWLPIPSNVSWIENQQRALNLRRAFSNGEAMVLGTFGSFTDKHLTKKLKKLVSRLLKNHGDRIWLFLGRGSEQFVEKMRVEFPSFAQRIETAGELDLAAISAHIQACDIMLQPYPQGVDTSRSSIMVGLSHGKPIVTSYGPKTELVWNNSFVRLTPGEEIDSLVEATENLISDKKSREKLAVAALENYKNYFSLSRSIETLVKQKSNLDLPITKH